MKLVTIIGARPQFIKAAVLSNAIKCVPNIDEIIVHTGQHYDINMSDVFFRELKIPKPDINLNIGSGDHGAQTGKMLAEIEIVLLKYNPTAVLVYGDTNSTLAGALAAAKMHIPIVHVEAGLRSFNKKMPEEINRILTDHISDILLAPTQIAIDNLLNEGLPHDKIKLVGDIMYESALRAVNIAEVQSKILVDNNLVKKKYLLSTIHRAENTDNTEKLLLIFEQLKSLSDNFDVVIPIHPRTKRKLDEIGFVSNFERLKIIEPLGYIDMQWLIKNSNVVITDSGGLQKEAYFHDVPSVIVREQTEWVELVEHGFNFLANNVREISMLVMEAQKVSFDSKIDFYGRGDTSQLILKVLNSHYSKSIVD